MVCAEQEWFPMTGVQDQTTQVTELDTSEVPFRITDDLYVPSERYYEPEFMAAEKEVWLHVWQHAAHETEIPNPGDFTEYKILDQSVMLIRQTDGTVKGFYNACRHRGTALASGSGTFRGSQVVCPFHGWRWNLDGSNSYVYTKQGFRPDTVEQAEVNLPEVAVGLKWGFVWINFDVNGTPFEENFRGLENGLDPHGFEKMHVMWWHQLEFAANWKIAQEAFFEAYHVMQSHPEMAMFQRDEDFLATAVARYADNQELGHTWSMIRQGPRPEWEKTQVDPNKPSAAELYHANIMAMWEGGRSNTSAQQAAIADDLIHNIPDEEYFDEFLKRVYADAAARNVPIPIQTPEMTNHWTAFPNYTGVVKLGCSLTYRSRPHPTDPNKCIYDFWGLEIPPEGTPIRRPQIAGDDAPTWDDLWFVQQDASNIERMQTGIRNKAHRVQRLGPELEKMIINWHHRMDQLIAQYK